MCGDLPGGVAGSLWAELRPQGAAVLPPGRPQPWGPGRHSPVFRGFSWGLPSSSLGERNHRSDKTTPSFPKNPSTLLKQDYVS